MGSNPLLTPAVLRRIAPQDRQKFIEDVSAVTEAGSEAQGLRAFWELAIRWERVYPTVLESLEGIESVQSGLVRSPLFAGRVGRVSISRSGHLPSLPLTGRGTRTGGQPRA
jgi:hypothetical protein